MTAAVGSGASCTPRHAGPSGRTGPAQPDRRPLRPGLRRPSPRSAGWLAAGAARRPAAALRSRVRPGWSNGPRIPRRPGRISAAPGPGGRRGWPARSGDSGPDASKSARIGGGTPRAGSPVRRRPARRESAGRRGGAPARPVARGVSGLVGPGSGPGGRGERSRRLRRRCALGSVAYARSGAGMGWVSSGGERPAATVH